MEWRERREVVDESKAKQGEKKTQQTCHVLGRLVLSAVYAVHPYNIKVETTLNSNSHRVSICTYTPFYGRQSRHTLCPCQCSCIQRSHIHYTGCLCVILCARSRLELLYYFSFFFFPVRVYFLCVRQLYSDREIYIYGSSTHSTYFFLYVPSEYFSRCWLACLICTFIVWSVGRSILCCFVLHAFCETLASIHSGHGMRTLVIRINAPGNTSHWRLLLLLPSLCVLLPMSFEKLKQKNRRRRWDR